MNEKVVQWKSYDYPKSKLGEYYVVGNEIRYIINSQNTEETKTELVSRTPFVLCGRTEPLEDGTVYYTVRYAVRNDQKEFVAKQSELLIKQSLKAILTGYGINVTDSKMLDKALEYISQCMHQYGDCLKTTSAVISSGWNEDCSLFALSRSGVTINGASPIQTLVTTPEHIGPFHTSGSLTGWVNYVTLILGYDVTRFLLYDAMTAPLIKPLKMEYHTFVHHGPTSSGKTAIENVISSTMGDPKSLEFIANSTKNAMLAHVYGMSDIPVDIEEATEEKARMAMADAVYDIANGKEKGRCGVDGKFRTDIKKFRTTAHVTCENPLRDQMKNAGAAYRAQHISDRLPEGLGDMVNATKKGVQENYGFFFPLYVQHIIKNMDNVKESYGEAIQKIETEGIPEESRDIALRSKNIYAGRQNGDYTVNISGNPTSGIRIIRKAMRDKLDLLEIRDANLKYYFGDDPKLTLQRKVLETVEFLKKMHCFADSLIIEIIVESGDVKEALSELERKGKVFKGIEWELYIIPSLFFGSYKEGNSSI